jgi:cell division protein FtsB
MMKILNFLKITGSGSIVLVFSIVLNSYFLLSVINGDFSVFVASQAKIKNNMLNEELENLKIKVQIQENLNRRISSKSLDLDLLDEQARKVLGYARADEIIIIN